VVTIYHNPGCSTSRAVLEMIRAEGLQPRVVEYLKTPPTREELLSLLRRMEIPVRDLVRAKEPLFAELGLGAEGVSDDELVTAMLAHPILMNRPVVVTEHGARLCRPAESVFDVLPPRASSGS
jgi:arsenate reductase